MKRHERIVLTLLTWAIWQSVCLAYLPLAITPQRAVVISKAPAVAVSQQAPDPITIFGTDLAAWYDPSDAATVTKSSNLVSQLNDKSGNGYNLTAAGSARPTYSSTGILGNTPGLYFNGSGNIMTASSVNMGTTTFSMFTLSSLNELGGTTYEFCGYTANGDAGDFSSHSSILFMVKSAKLTTQVPSNQHPADSSTIQLDGVAGQPFPCGIVKRFGTVLDGSNIQIFVDNQGSSLGAYTPPPFVAPGTLAFGDRIGGGQPWQGYMGETVILKRAPTSIERDQLHSWFIRSWSSVLVTEGDSITHDGPPSMGTPEGSSAAHGGYTYLSWPNQSPKRFLDNIAISGTDFWSNAANDLWDRTTNYTNTRLPLNKYGKKYILYFTFANQVVGGFHSGSVPTAATYAAGIATYASAQKTAGWDKIVTATALSRTDGALAGGNDTLRNAYNAIIRDPSWSGLVANGGPIDAVVDFAADSIMGVDQAPTVNSSYFADGVHPSSTGHARLEAIFTPVINALP